MHGLFWQYLKSGNYCVSVNMLKMFWISATIALKISENMSDSDISKTNSRRKSVSWQVEPERENESENRSETNLPFFHRRSTRHAPRKPSVSSKISNSSLLKLFRCCNVDDDDWPDDTSSHFSKRVYSKRFSEEYIIVRLQEAVNERVHRTPYELESEIAKWNKTLDLEHRAYEESGQRKFKYKWFRQNLYLAQKNHPLYGTSYDNHRKLEPRLEFFRFGGNLDERFDLSLNQVHHKYLEDNTAYHDAGHWKSKSHALFATLALVCSASNFLRFPHACYANGGFIFLLTYCLMIAAVGQPLLYFEMVLGQYSLHGPSGFASLHPHAKGLPYAIAFVCVVFGTTKSVILAYCVLYSIASLFSSPGYCGSWWRQLTACFPYVKLESEGAALRNLWASRPSDATYQTPSVTVFSIELFFREVILDTKWMQQQRGILHWKLILTSLIVFSLSYIPIHYNLTGKTMRTWMRHSLLLPLMILVLFLHQAFSRGGIYETVSYFLTIDMKHVSALNLWSQAFEMVLSTLGIGYGFHWSISGRTPFHYRDTYKTSWIICGCAVLFGLISSLVIFCEIGIVGEIVRANGSHYHVFVERLGISFVSYSGALLKLGGNTSIASSIFFFIFAIYGMWSQILIADIILRWIEHGQLIKGRVLRVVNRKVSSVFVVIGLQIIIISPYFFEKGSAVLDSENVFGGSLAAYTVVLAEVFVVVYLYGFNRFLVDLEIMTKTPLPALFQIQIRYIVIPAIWLFMIPMLINAYVNPSLFSDRNFIGKTLYIGVIANFVPLLVIIGFALFAIFVTGTEEKPNNVGHEPFLYDQNEDMLRMRKPIEPRFSARHDAPSQQSHSRTVRSEVYHAVQHSMNYIYQAQMVVQRQFKKLLNFKRIQTRWLNLILKVVWKMKVRSMRRLVQRLMLRKKYNNNRIDIHFLERSLEQIVHLTFYSGVRKLQRMPMNELLLFLADELIQLTTFHPEEFIDSELSGSESSSTSREESHEENPNLPFVETVEENEIGYLKIHRKIIGRFDRSPDEDRVLLTIRIKRGLQLPYVGDLGVLKFLRRQRACQEREYSCWTMNDSMPIDHFIPVSISKDGEKICFTVFHGVVVYGDDHFILKKLPIPRPDIIRVTKSFVHSQPGADLPEKFSNLISKRMRRRMGEILKKRNMKTWSKRKLKRHMWRVSDRVDDDVYDFLDHILTCVIIILKKDTLDDYGPRLYLTPTTHRRTIPKVKKKKKKKDKKNNEDVKDSESKHAEGIQLPQPPPPNPSPSPPPPPPPIILPELEMVTYNELVLRRMRDNVKLELEQEASDILFHNDSSDSSESEELITVGHGDAHSSSGSSSSLSGDEFKGWESPLSILSGNSLESITSQDEQLLLQTNYMISNETLQNRDRKSLRRKLTEKNVIKPELWVNPDKVKHMSARRWTLQRNQSPTSMKVVYTDKEIALHKAVGKEANKLAVLPTMSKSAGIIKSKEHLDLKKAFSLQSLRHLLHSEVEFDLQRGELVAVPNMNSAVRRLEEKLGNTSPDLIFVSHGKTMIVSHGMGGTSIATIAVRRSRPTVGMLSRVSSPSTAQ